MRVPRERTRHRHRRGAGTHRVGGHAARSWWPVGAVALVLVVGASVFAVDRTGRLDNLDPPLLAATPPVDPTPSAVAPADLAGAPSNEQASPTAGGPTSTATGEPTKKKAPAAGRVAPGPATPAARGGLPWRSGLVVGTPSEVAEWEAYRGRPVDVVHGFTERGSWEGIESADWILGFYAKSPVAIVISQPFWPEGSGGSLGACASGAYDANWARYGKALTAAGRTDAYTRLAWEFNGDWFEWSATDVTAWKQCYRKVVQAVRSTAPGARFEWNINAHGSKTSGGSAWNSYPGNDVVDVVGIDPYDHYPASPTASAFDAQCNGSEGLCSVIAFARKNAKLVGVTEWGVIGGAGGGDNPLYIEKMFATFMAAKDVMGYETYFNEENYGNALVGPRQNPASADRYRALFGR